MRYAIAAAAFLTALNALNATPAIAQDVDPQPPIAPEDVPPGVEGTVFDGDFVTVGLGLAYGPSYTGSDDYVFTPIPLVQGRVGPVGIDPRPAGLALDFLPDAEGEIDVSLGVVARLRFERANRIEDPAVEAAGELDRAFEVGPTAGISTAGLLNPFDSLSATVDLRWDVAGAHDGMVIAPSISYFTPLSRAMAVSLSVSTEYADDDFANYYFSVSPAQSAASGLERFEADGGFNSVGANLLFGYDLDGDVTNGGLGVFAIGGYTRLVGDAKDTPYTSVRGDADQFLGAVGIGYTF